MSRQHLQVRQDGSGSGTRDRSFDESEASQPIVYSGIIAHRRLACPDTAHVVDETSVDVREGFKITFGVCGGDSRPRLGGGTQVALAGPQSRPRFTGGL